MLMPLGTWLGAFPAPLEVLELNEVMQLAGCVAAVLQSGMTKG
jgi:hypothetical protein